MASLADASREVGPDGRSGQRDQFGRHVGGFGRADSQEDHQRIAARDQVGELQALSSGEAMSVATRCLAKAPCIVAGQG